MASILSVILTAAALGYAVHAVIKFIYPNIKNILKGVIKDDKVTNSMINLLVIFIILTASSLIIDTLLTMGLPVVGYLEILKPTINMILGLTTYIEWIIIGAAVIIALRVYRKG